MSTTMASSSRTRSDTSTLYKYDKSSKSSFSSRSTSLVTSSSSPTRVAMYGCALSRSRPSVRFAIERPASPGRTISVRKQPSNGGGSRSGMVSSQKRTCMCSPTTHPGSFRCALHKNSAARSEHDHQTASFHSRSSSSSLNYRRSAMKNSLVRIGGVEGDLVRRALSALIRPSSQQQRRRAAFQPRPSRLSVMSKAEDS